MRRRGKNIQQFLNQYSHNKTWGWGYNGKSGVSGSSGTSGSSGNSGISGSSGPGTLYLNISSGSTTTTNYNYMNLTSSSNTITKTITPSSIMTINNLKGVSFKKTKNSKVLKASDFI